MSRLVAQMFISLDGVVQAPGDPGEDRSGGFRHGGWHLPYHDAAVHAWVERNNDNAAGYLIGRRTYDFFKDHWPAATEESVGSLARQMNEKTKWVVSATLDEPTTWAHCKTTAMPDSRRAVDELIGAVGGDLLLLGSTQLLGSLLTAGLVDRLHLVLDPIALGQGARLFPLDGTTRWNLVENQSTASGAVLLTYDAAA
ncbi:dihydrofolate reductase family protein [Amycolatopsis sp. 195334CR]|uniref:dihydrofolate reductase family protein n=1 Tax=Amycolatopsis sp. 195334CR TaxID=2814588 RepID=UPI001A8F4D70|nr:dihydrofolate reductase family protein [Amycolatopsis sp. 195334CR]MBN6038255.1 dihydrofolate reductase family protein [Amycolatopsis sp. 195334CR]